MKNSPEVLAQKRVCKQSFITFLACLIVWCNVNGKEKSLFSPIDTTTEKKVDYLEQIYFSGGNKAELKTKILIALQQLETKISNPALAKQFAFLSEIEAKTDEAKNACEVLDMLAVGIFKLDAQEASVQGVRSPSDKAKAKTIDAIESLEKLNSASNSISDKANAAALLSYVNSGNLKNYGTYSKVAGAAGKIGDAAGVASNMAKVAKQLNLFGGKDKPCNDVAKKTIEIGEHNLAVVSTATAIASAGTSALTTTVIHLPKISSAGLRSLVDTIKNKPGVQSVEKEFSEEVSIVTVIHTGNFNSLSDWVEDKFSSQYKLLESKGGKIKLGPKNGK